MTGKEKCKVLRQIRRDIAEANGIAVTERECTHSGPCRGTCPYCEAELKKLEGALREKRSLGQRVAVVGLSMGLLATSLTSCDLPFFSSATAGEPLAGDVPNTEQTEYADHIPGELVAAETTMGPEETVALTGEEPPLAGVPLPPPEETLMGDPVLPEGTVAAETTRLPEPVETP